MQSRWYLALKQLVHLFRAKPAPASYSPSPAMRNMISDIMTEGRRKNIIHLLFEVDAAAMRDRIKASPATLTITSCIAEQFAQAVQQNIAMQAYRQSRKSTILFDEVDIAVMVERDIDGTKQPIPYIVRHANQKSAGLILNELRAAQTAELGKDGPLSALENVFFNLPKWTRSIAWFFIRRDPQAFKQLVGTVGLTSMGMHGHGSAVCLPITPMTLTLSVGTIGKRLVMQDGMPCEREILQLNLSADHDLIDGVPLMRFAEHLKNRLENQHSH